MPEFLKHFIVANASVLFALLLIAGSVGLWTMGKQVRRIARRGAMNERPPREASAPGDAAPLAEALDAANRRIDHLEALLSFDRKLVGARSSSKARNS